MDLWQKATTQSYYALAYRFPHAYTHSNTCHTRLHTLATRLCLHQHLCNSIWFTILSLLYWFLS